MRPRGPAIGAAAEVAFAGAILAGVGWVVWRFLTDGYLPQPFYYQVNETLMDLYSTAYWAHHAGAYTLWRAVYPPISFDFLRGITDRACYGGDGYQARACDGLASGALLALFFANAALVWLSYRPGDRRSALPRAAAVAFGLPMLYALERGNLLIPCFTAFVLGVGPLIRSPAWRVVALAVSVNFKPYLLAVFLPAVARREWRWLLGFGAAGLAVYLVTFALEGTGTPWQLLADMGGYTGDKRDTLWANLYFSTSYWPLARFVGAHQAFAAGLDSSLTAGLGLVLISLMRAAQLGSLICMLAALARPSGVDAKRFMALYATLILTTVTNGSSGYAQFFLIFLIFFEPWRGRVRITILVCAYLLCLPIDWAFWPVVRGPAHSFLGGRDVTVAFGVSVGQIVRPALLLVINFGLIALNLRDILGARGAPAAQPCAPSVAGARPTL